jgi:hypothetical protein
MKKAANIVVRANNMISRGLFINQEVRDNAFSTRELASSGYISFRRYVYILVIPCEYILWRYPQSRTSGDIRRTHPEEIARGYNQRKYPHGNIISFSISPSKQTTTQRPTLWNEFSIP